MAESPSKKRQASFYMHSMLAGGIAGGVAKTAVAPLDRIKILFQTHHHEYKQFSGDWRGVYHGLRHIIHSQGFLALYRGNSLTLARAVPHAALGYTVYDTVSQIMMPTPPDQTPFRRMVAGSIAGVSVLPITYPFELARVRMAITTQRLAGRPSISQVFRHIYNEKPLLTPGGMANFYRGFAVTLAGTIPYRGGIFLAWETLNQYSNRHLSARFRERHRHKLHLLIGAIAGTSAQIITYPLEVIRRIQQAGGHGLSNSNQPLGVCHTMSTIWRLNGWRGYYVGLGIGLIKQVPMHSISLSVWQAAKTVLGI
ncbi:unnamed protein product [Cyclocybe aegerita]|uniref:Mitochondrial carrier protein n=1 Tax=Cyclocybe aegerita TaxID=1973307 RepID=A0A8S0WW89_CYCAE|nr:unnamed protein product [Cyclocybe aegerita]